MLYLNPPYYMIEGVSLFPDHNNKPGQPQQYYYLPAAPHLTVLDGDNGPIPQIQLIKGRGRAGNIGFLNFDVNLGIAEGTLNKVAEKLREMAGLDDLPLLAPVPVIDGSVRLLILGKQTGDPATPVERAGLPQFVTKIDQFARPGLYGTNQAAFSVTLDQYGVTVMEQALRGEMSPIGIVYSLDYLALRPAYQVKVNVDWNRVQKHLEEHFKVDILVFSADIEKVVDELIESRVIEIDVDTFIPEGEDNTAVLGRRDRAVNDVRDMITEAFFKPSIDPVNPESGTGEGIARAIDRIHDATRAPLRVFSYQKVDITRIDRKTLDVTMNERTTVKRSIYPQGHLAGLFSELEQAGDLSRFIIPVDLDDPWFQRRKLNVISRGNFEEDAIGSINVRLGYNSQPQNVLLESSTARVELDWPSVIANNAMQRGIDYSYTVSFKGVDGTERPIEITSPVETTDVDNLEINPRELYSIVSVPVVALSFPWDRYPQVEAHLQYSDDANGIRMSDTLLLTKDRAEQVWKIFVRDPLKKQFQHKLIMRAADNRDIELPWTAVDDERVTIRDPRPNKRTLSVVPSLDFSAVDRAFVDLSYEDADNDVFAEQSFEFNAGDTASKTFSVALVDPARRAITFQATILLKNRITIEVPPSVTMDRRIIIRSDMRGHRIVTVRPEQASFAERHLRAMKVDVRYVDEDAGLSFADIFSFTTPDMSGTFEYDYLDEQRVAIEYRVTYLYSNGLLRDTDWTPARGDVLAVPVA